MTNPTIVKPGQNGIWVKFQHFCPINYYDGEKWSRKNIFEIPHQVLSDSAQYNVQTDLIHL